MGKLRRAATSMGFGKAEGRDTGRALPRPPRELLESRSRVLIPARERTTGLPSAIARAAVTLDWALWKEIKEDMRTTEPQGLTKTTEKEVITLPCELSADVEEEN